MAFCKNQSMTEKLVGQAPQEKLDRPTSGNVFRRLEEHFYHETKLPLDW
jgi:hypothetical protein